MEVRTNHKIGENPQTLTGQAFQRFGRTKSAIKYNHLLPFTFDPPSATTKHPCLLYLNFDIQSNHYILIAVNHPEKPPGNQMNSAAYQFHIAQNLLHTSRLLPGNDVVLTAINPHRQKSSFTDLRSGYVAWQRGPGLRGPWRGYNYVNHNSGVSICHGTLSVFRPHIIKRK